MVLDEVLRASKVAFIICSLSIVCLLVKLIPAYYFLGVLGAWTIYSAYRLLGLILSQPTAAPNGKRDKAGLSYWLGALGSSLLAALVWIVFVALVFASARSLP